MTDTSTIFALSSAPGRAGVAVIRISGAAVPSVLQRMSGPSVGDRKVGYRRIVHPLTRQLLDHAVVLYFASPSSETGEHVAEFQVHGGRAVVRAVLDGLAAMPECRMAEPGEFARRAFYNGRIDLAAAEALADLIDAETEAQRAFAMQASVTSHYWQWREKALEMAALTEAAIDFSDEKDVSLSSFEIAQRRATALIKAIEGHLDDGHRGEILREGFRVALLGPPNAGKSSLLNWLAKREAAIVSEEAGTTRDVIEVRLDLKGWPVIVSDTAGIRETEGAVEREGIKRSIATSKAANLTLWLTETGSDLPPADISRETSLVIRTKADLGKSESNATKARAISTKTGAGLDELLAEITSRAESAMAMHVGVDLVVARGRHRQHLETAVEALRAFVNGEGGDIELRAEDVRQAANALGRIIGAIDAEDVLGEIFGRFCIGK